MESHAFWRDREAEFLGLARDRNGHLVDFEPPSSLHAIRVSVDLPAVLAGATSRALSSISNPVAPTESVYAHVRTAGRAGRILLAGERADSWILSGGGSEEVARATLQNNFRAEAVIAAVGACALDPAMSDQTVIEAWLDLLVELGSPHYRADIGVIEHVALASAEACRQLGARAYRHSRADAAGRDEQPILDAAQPKRFPGRAAWLKKAMENGVVVDGVLERQLSANRIEVLSDDKGKITRKTIGRILRGQPVQPRSLDVLAKVLRFPSDRIPND